MCSAEGRGQSEIFVEVCERVEFVGIYSGSGCLDWTGLDKWGHVVW